MEEVTNTNKALMRIREILFFFSFGVFLIRRLFGDVTLWKLKYPVFDLIQEKFILVYDNYLVWILLICIGLAFFTSIPKIERILMFVALIGLGKLVSVYSEETHMYLSFLFIVAAFGISARKILTFGIGINLPLMTITVVAAKCGLIENRIEEYRNREFLGYNWTTTPVMIFSYGVFGYIILRKGKINIWEYLVLNAINCWFFVKTNTRFAFLLVFLILTFFMVYRFISDRDRQHNGYRNVFVLIPEICFAFIYLITMLYTPTSGIMAKLNKLLSRRLSQCQYSIGKYGLLPFGQKIQWVATSQSTPDNPATYVDTAYLQILLKFGHLSIIAFLLISSYVIYRSFKNKNYVVALVFCFILLFGLFEQQLYWIEFDMVLLLAFADWSTLRKNAPLYPEQVQAV